MPSSIRNIVIFLGIAAVFTSVYIFYFKKSTPEGNFVVNQNNAFNNSAQNTTTTNSNASTVQKSLIAQNLLSKLLNLKDVHLDNSIFSNKAFVSLRDSTITIEPDQSEGRPNPFAKFGADGVESSVTPNTSSWTPLLPPVTVDTGPKTQ